MANKQKSQRNVSKKPCGEKTQRNVHIIKHFQPITGYHKLHKNCEFPEVNADIDTKETLNKIKKCAPSQAPPNRNKKTRITSTIIPNPSSRTKPLILSLTSSLAKSSNTDNKLKSKTNYSLTSSSSTIKEALPLKPKQTGGIVRSRWKDGIDNSRSYLRKNLKSITTSSTSSTENKLTNAKTFQTIYKSKSFSVGNKNKDEKASKSKFVSTSGPNVNKTIEDLKREIRANQLQKKTSHVKDNININSRRERVEMLRDEIKNLININLDDKRKHLTELATEIAEFRTNKDFLVYNVDTKNDDQNKPTEKKSPTNNETVQEAESLLKTDLDIKSSKKFLELPVEACEEECHQIPVETELGSTEKDIRPISKVETKWKPCHKCVTTEDVVQTKIQKTNQLIENLQKTLDEIRSRTKTAVKEVGTFDDIETEKATEKIEQAEAESDGGETETERESEEDKIAGDPSEVTEKPDVEEEEDTPPSQIPDVSLEESPEVNDTVTVAELKTAVENLDNVEDAVVIDFPRPKTRRPCCCIEEDVITIDKFRTAPADGTGEMDEFDILQAKLNAIVESTESDHSHVSEPKPEEKGGGPRVSFVGSAEWLFKDFLSRGPSDGTQSFSVAATQSVSTATSCVLTRPNASQTARPSLVRKKLDAFDIAPKKPQLQLTVQVLPTVNVDREPVAGRLVSFYIDSHGKTHVIYKMGGGNVGFFEIQSTSLTKVFSADNSEAPSTRGKVHERRAEGEVSSPLKHTKERRSYPDGRHSRVRRQKSFSDTDFYVIKGKPLSSETLDDIERKKVLQSYQLLDNKNKHDPGVLSAESLDVISAIDEDVYKTYINPLGFANAQASPSTYMPHRTKAATLDKLSSKLLIKGSESDAVRSKRSARSTKSDKSIQTDSKTIEEQPELEGDPKLYNIGLYKSTSTQMVLFSDESTTASEHDDAVKKKKLEALREEEDASTEIEIKGGVGVEYEWEEEEGEGGVKPESSSAETRRREEEARKEMEIKGGIGVERVREKKKEEDRGEMKPELSSAKTRSEEEARKEIEIKGGLGVEYGREEKKREGEGKLRRREEEARKEMEIKGEVCVECSKKKKKEEDKGKIKPELSSAETRRKDEEARKEMEIKGRLGVESAREKKKGEDRGGIKPGPSSALSRPQDAESSMSYERISFSISYSTEESITEVPSEDVAQGIRKPSQTEQPTMTEQCESTPFANGSEYQPCREQRLKSGSYVRRSKDIETFKSLREKITKEHSLDVHSSLPTQHSESDSEEDKRMSNVTVPDFISGLLESTTASLKRVIPHIKKSVRSAKSDIRQSTVFGGRSLSEVLTEKSEDNVEGGGSSELPTRKSTNKSVHGSHHHHPSVGFKSSHGAKPVASWVNPKDSDDETEMGGHHYHVAPVHVQGDFVPMTYRRRFKPSGYALSPLQVGRNGRYKDEEELFCESNSPRYENSLHGRFSTIPPSLYEAKFNLDSSTSDTVTNADRTFSQGEVRCGCSVSIGELHVCRRRRRRSPSRSRRPQPLLVEDHTSGIRRRSSYFNNWVTYYVNKNAFSLNDSSSTS